MAKPILPENLSPNLRAGVAAGLLLDAKTTELSSHADLAMAGDVDGVHDLRVAVKRLREAVRVFRRLTPGKERAQVLRIADEFNDALGRVRELDVLITDVRALHDQVPDGQVILSVLLDVWAEERRRAHVEMVSAWDRALGRGRLFQKLRRLARAAKKRKKDVANLPLDQFAYYAVAARLERVLQRVDGAQNPEDLTALHRLRIAVKRMKYTMELFLTIFPALASPYSVVTDAQEALGLAHDHDVLRSALQQYFENTGLSGATTTAGILQVVDRRREELYAAARERAAALGTEVWRRETLDAID